MLNTCYIDGQWVTHAGDLTVALIDPVSETLRDTLLCSGPDTVAIAVNAATEAYAGWSTPSISTRLEVLRGLTDAIAARREDFAQTIRTEIGSPIEFSRTAQVDAALNHLEAITVALSNSAEDMPLADDPAHRVRYEPIGVAGLITPWNWPLNQVVLKVGAALAAGCTIVLKPSEYAPQTAMLLAQVIDTLKLPAGVFNLIIGDGQTGAALVSHPDVNIVSFTGSTRAGAHISANAAGRFARTALELGGKSPNILFSDCDLETAITQGLAHCFRNSGQSCNAASRMLVERSIYDAAVELAGRIANDTRVGHPDAEGIQLGPLVNRVQFDRVQGYIEKGIASEARLVAGGLGRPEGLDVGFFARPTVFADVTVTNVIFREEIFGPVLTMSPFEDEDEAVALANDSAYGLAAYIQTNCPTRADRVARQLKAGMIQVNGISRAQGAPFGGYKASGYGREAGLWGIRAFQEIKSISGVPRAIE